MTIHHASRLAAAAALCALTPAVFAAAVSVRLDPINAAGMPFPSNRYTVFDAGNNTLRRVNLPKPDCAVQASDCQDIDVLNTLDGFSTQPRITVPFTGNIDPGTVTSETVYLVNLGDTLSGAGSGQRVGINQVVWDPETKTLAFESDQLLQEFALPAGGDGWRAGRQRRPHRSRRLARRRHRPGAGPRPGQRKRIPA